MPDKEIIVITKENMDQYVNFPDHILKKWKNTYCDGKENEIKSAHPLDILYAITNKI